MADRHDPILQMILDEIVPGWFGRLDIEQRAFVCCLDERQRGRLVWSMITDLHKRMEDDLIYGRREPILASSRAGRADATRSRHQGRLLSEPRYQ